MNYIKIIDFFQEALNLLKTALALVGCSGNWKMHHFNNEMVIFQKLDFFEMHACINAAELIALLHSQKIQFIFSISLIFVRDRLK